MIGLLRSISCGTCLCDTLRNSPEVLSFVEFRRDSMRGVDMKLPLREPDAELSPEGGSSRLAYEGRGDGTRADFTDDRDPLRCSVDDDGSFG